jgi:ribosomal protein S18 acetylase RimI-like enzyme
MIVEADSGDEAAVVALWHACSLTRPWNDPAADFKRALATPTSTVLLLRTDDRLVGTVMAGFDGHRGWIYYLGVMPDARRQGTATRLLEAATDWLARRGCPKVELMVRSGNAEAVALYSKLGWEKQPVDVYGIWTERD